MRKSPFQAIMLLAVLLPLLSSLIGYLLYAPSQSNAPQAVSSLPGPDAQEPVLINKAPEATPMNQSREIGFKEMILYIALLAGVIALLWIYMETSLAWIAVILLPLLFSFIYREQAGMSLTLFYLVNLAFAALLAQLVRFVFFQRSIMRFRMIVTSIVGAALLTLYIRALYLITGTVFQTQQWTQLLMSGLILFIFVTFGMSLADMVIQRHFLRLRQAEEKAREDDDPDA